MEFGSLKPVITALVMPLALLPLLALMGLLLAKKYNYLGRFVSVTALLGLWLLSCEATAVWLSQAALPQYPPANAAQLKARGVQAIVVLGGGLHPEAPEYGKAQPGPATAARLRYGIWLSKQSGLPIAFSGGNGWSAGSKAQSTEAEAAERVAVQDYGITLRWLEAESRDTAENARLVAPMLKRDGIERIALVTDALHMPRAMQAFEGLGLIITAAPTGFVLPAKSSLLQWLPTANGISKSTRVLHELLGLTVAKLR